MAKRVRLESAVSGATASARRVLAAATVTTADPILSSEGVSTQRVELLHLLFQMVVAGTFQLQLWWWSDTSGRWQKGEVLNVNDDDIKTVEINGLPRLYIQVTGVTGASASLNAWVDLVVQET